MQAKEIQWVLLLLIAAVEEEEACYDTQYCRSMALVFWISDFALPLVKHLYHHNTIIRTSDPTVQLYHAFTCRCNSYLLQPFEIQPH